MVVKLNYGVTIFLKWAIAKLCYPNGRTSSRKDVNGKTERS